LIFIDTGAFVALYNVADQYHALSTRQWRRLWEMKQIAITSNFVVNESLTLLARRAGYPFAVQRARALYASDRVTIIRPTHDDELDAISYLEKYADQEVGFTDCYRSR
jgi:uncharacterized protein